jgi:TonB family protein
MIRAVMSLSLMILPAFAFQNIGISDSGPSKRIVKMTKPAYPLAAKTAGIQGSVQMEALVAKDGTVKSVSNVSGRPELIPAAVDAVKEWIYEPVVKDNQAVEFSVTVTLNFSLQKGAAAAPVAKDAIEIPGSVQQGKLVNKVSPLYPSDAKAAGLEGSVKLRVLIGADGMMKEIRNVSGPLPLIQSSVDAVRQWIWKPTFVDGAPTPVITEIAVNYRLAR